MPFRCLFHIHTWHSVDSLLSPRAIVARAREELADALIVTDHDSLQGSEDVAGISEGNPRFVVRAGEYKTEKGDVIGLFLKKEITARNCGEVLDEIRQQGGLAVLPHPYKAHKIDDELLSQVDLIEVCNSRCSEAQNNSAMTLAQSLEKPIIGGCDAHCAAEIGAVTTVFSCAPPLTDEELRAVFLTATREIHARRVSRIYQPYSQLIKACKTCNPTLFAYQAKQLASAIAKEALSL